MLPERVIVLEPALVTDWVKIAGDRPEIAGALTIPRPKSSAHCGVSPCPPIG
jgi:hypothetical protein